MKENVKRRLLNQELLRSLKGIYCTSVFYTWPALENSHLQEATLKSSIKWLSFSINLILANKHLKHHVQANRFIIWIIFERSAKRSPEPNSHII